MTMLSINKSNRIPNRLRTVVKGFLMLNDKCLMIKNVSKSKKEEVESNSNRLSVDISTLRPTGKVAITAVLVVE